MTSRRASQATTPIVSTNGEFEVVGIDLPFRRVSSVSFPPQHTCEAAALVLGQTLQVGFTCSGEGQVAVYYPGNDARELFAMFRAAVERTGGQVTFTDGTVGVLGGNGSSAAMFGQAEMTDQTRQVQGATAFTVVNPPQDDVTHIISDAVSYTPRHFWPLPGGVTQQDVASAANELSLDVTFLDFSGRTYVVTTEDHERYAIEAIISGLNHVSLFAQSQELTSEELEMVRDYCAGSVVTPIQAGFRITGTAYAANDCAAFFSSAFPASVDYKIDAAFLSFDRGTDQDFTAALGLNVVQGLGNSQTRVSLGTISDRGFQFSLDFALTNFNASVVSRPTLTTSSGRTGRFVSGQSVPTLSTTETDGNTTETFQYRDVGVVLNATPQTLPNGLISVSLDLELSSLSEADGVGGNPVVNTQRLQTNVIVSPGDVVVLSGLTVDENLERRSRSIFRPGRNSNSRQRSLQIILTVERDL